MMTRRIVIQRAAARDLEDQADYLAIKSEALAQRDSEAVEDAFRQLATMPGIGSLQAFRQPAFAGLRCFRVPGFKKYLIFYQHSEDQVRVVRGLHGARDLPRRFQDESEVED